MENQGLTGSGQKLHKATRLESTLAAFELAGVFAALCEAGLVRRLPGGVLSVGIDEDKVGGIKVEAEEGLALLTGIAASRGLLQEQEKELRQGPKMTELSASDNCPGCGHRLDVVIDRLPDAKPGEMLRCTCGHHILFLA